MYKESDVIVIIFVLSTQPSYDIRQHIIILHYTYYTYTIRIIRMLVPHIHTSCVIHTRIIDFSYQLKYTNIGIQYTYYATDVYCE